MQLFLPLCRRRMKQLKRALFPNRLLRAQWWALLEAANNLSTCCFLTCVRILLTASCGQTIPLTSDEAPGVELVVPARINLRMSWGSVKATIWTATPPIENPKRSIFSYPRACTNARTLSAHPWKVVGTSPLVRPTPALSKMTISRATARLLSRSGSQKSLAWKSAKVFSHKMEISKRLHVTTEVAV